MNRLDWRGSRTHINKTPPGKCTTRQFTACPGSWFYVFTCR
uniref:Uncharacterized protein n=1 Tax=Enterobacter hormaechei subsp. xiangfangensis TaxID=1296536 RepID=A0A6C0L1X6_9ENTR|nr:hypothetical protein pLAU_ENM30_NDM1_00111 [Enterobacter hormaechei subsp. xiangfangensis]